jgi:DNA mismatch endonuclease, patch repair protein
MDRLSRSHRSWNMSRIKSQDTSTELTVRSVLHDMGYRFRLHRKDLPGNPDIVLPKYRTVIFVHGCFWHRHTECKYAYTPKSNVEFWEKKFKANVERDQNNNRILQELGWRIIVIWECQTQNLEPLKYLLKTSLANACYK